MGRQRKLVNNNKFDKGKSFPLTISFFDQLVTLEAVELSGV